MFTSTNLGFLLPFSPFGIIRGGEQSSYFFALHLHLLALAQKGPLWVAHKGPPTRGQFEKVLILLALCKSAYFALAKLLHLQIFDLYRCT